MAVPFETDLPEPHATLLRVEKADVIGLLHRVARDLIRLEHSLLRDGQETLAVLEASRAVHLALVELDPIA